VIAGRVSRHPPCTTEKERIAMDLDALEKQVTLLEDIHDIENLERIYGYYFDSHQYDKVVDLFSDNAVSAEIESHGVFNGKEGVRRFYWDDIGKKGQTLPPWLIRLLIIQIGAVITVDPDGKTAKGRWQTWLPEVMPSAAGPRQVWLHGYYENEYIKENGKWLFTKIYWNVTFYTTYETGWLRFPMLGYFPFPNYDEPPTNFHPYPSGYRVPYHWEGE
jgi:hypothetical protein